jgi:hypothetical protein
MHSGILSILSLTALLLQAQPIHSVATTKASGLTFCTAPNFARGTCTFYHTDAAPGDKPWLNTCITLTNSDGSLAPFSLALNPGPLVCLAYKDPRCPCLPGMDCGKPGRAHGWCRVHEHRIYKDGTKDSLCPEDGIFPEEMKALYCYLPANWA